MTKPKMWNADLQHAFPGAFPLRRHML